jgi:hypothetical protein
MHINTTDKFTNQVIPSLSRDLRGVSVGSIRRPRLRCVVASWPGKLALWIGLLHGHNMQGLPESRSLDKLGDDHSSLDIPL